jgi:uncharacterized cupin superfamily protein
LRSGRILEAIRGSRASSLRFISIHEDDEAWYVLTGALVVRTDDHDYRLGALHLLEQPDESTIAAMFEEHASSYLGWP